MLRDHRRPAESSEGFDPIECELRTHLELTTQDLIAEGWDPEDARREAERRFGSLLRIERECRNLARPPLRNRWRFPMLTAVRTDLVYAFRSFLRRPVFLIVAVGTLGLGVGASTTIFSVVDAVVLRSLPYPDADRLVLVGPDRNRPNPSSMSPLNFRDLAEGNDVLGVMSASRLQALTLMGDDGAEGVRVAGVSGTFFSALGASALLGRILETRDDQVGAEPTAVLSYGYWQRRWGGRRDLVGQRLVLSGQSFTVVGVMPPDFVPPEGIYHRGVELWHPLAFISDDLQARDNSFLQVIGRLRPGVTEEAAAASLTALQQAIYAEIPPDDFTESREQERIAVARLREATVGAVRPAMLLLLGAVGFLMLIVCANVANLFLARAAERDREVGMRIALGAGRGRIGQQLLTEGITLSLIGAAVGVALAFGGVELFVALSPDNIPRLSEVAVDGRVLAITTLASVVVGVLFGLAPAWHLSRTDPTDALRTRNIGGGRSRTMLRSGLVVVEAAMTLVLLVGAGLLMNSFVRLVNVDPGFEANGVVRMAVLARDYEDAETRQRFWDALVERVRGIPGVSTAALTTNLPMTGNRSVSFVSVENDPSTAEEAADTDVHRVTPEYFNTLRIPLLAGRDFTAADDAVAPPVAIVNTAFAERFLQGRLDGRRLRFGPINLAGEWIDIIGIVGTIDQQALGERSGPGVYLPAAQRPRSFMNVIARSNGETAAVVTAMRTALREVNPQIPVDEIGTLTAQLDQTVVTPRFYSVILTVFAGVALALAAAGLYGTLSYTVEQRRQEVGVRMALGAKTSDVLRLIVRQGMLAAGIGLTIGLAGAAFLSSSLESFLFGISALDPLTFLGVSAVFGLVALAACLLPAHRAATVNPVETLREE